MNQPLKNADNQTLERQPARRGRPKGSSKLHLLPAISSINRKLINVSEIARQLNVSSVYIYYILTGRRKSLAMQERILEIVNNVSKNAS